MNRSPVATKLTAITKIDDVLTRGSQQLGGISRGQEVQIRANFHG